jgi:hypothetical protein
MTKLLNVIMGSWFLALLSIVLFIALIDYWFCFLFFGRCFQVHGSALYDNKNTYWHPVYTGRPWEHISVRPSASEPSEGLFGG